MKFTILAILIIIFLLGFVLPAAYRGLKDGVANYFNKKNVVDSATGTSSGAVKPETATSTVVKKIQNLLPGGFRGPVGQPHIIGPTSPPPNY